MAPYVFVALAYDKIQRNGFIAEKFMFLPDSLGQNEALSKFLSDNSCGLQDESFVGEFIVEQNLNKEFCEKLKQSPSLRYLTVVGFHEAKILGCKLENNNLSIKVNYSGCWSAPNLDKEECTITLCNVEFENIDDYSNLYIDGFRVCYEQGKLGFQLTLNNRGKILITKKLEIFCEDVLLE